MATWITHLRIAEKLLAIIPNLDPHQFAIGNVAPDSGMPDEKWETFNPPTSVTHIAAPPGAAHQLADLDFYRQYLQGTSRDREPARYSFLLGYFCHLVTDNLWSQQIGKPASERWQAQFAANPDFIWEVKQDWYGLDFEYVRSHPECLYWKVFLDCAYPQNYLDFLLVEGVRQRVAYIQEYYRSTNEDIEGMVSRQRVYLTANDIDDFVSSATLLFYDSIVKLGTAPSIADGYISVLEFQPGTILQSKPLHLDGNYAD